MQGIKKYTPFFISALLMYVVFVIIYPHYCYYIDPDGTSYLTISRRYAADDYLKAVNSFWSPWSCWLTALCIKTEAIIPASWIINSFAGLGCLFITQSFFIKLNVTNKLQWLFSITLALFLCYAIFWQSFDDLWECFLLLSVLRIMLIEGFKNKPILWVIYGIVGAIAYFSKAYSFPFILLNTLCCTYFICKDNKAQWLKIFFVTSCVMTLCSLPWIYAIHYKYGKWMISSAGPLNMAWFIIGHPYWRDGIDVLLPPAYKDSPYYWEDPYIINGVMPHFWNSWQLAGREVMRAGYNSYKLIYCVLQLSVFLPVIAVVAIKKMRQKQAVMPIRIMTISCVLLPLGYLLATFETRYLWYMLILGMLLGIVFIQNSLSKARGNIMALAFALSILAFPLWCMKKMYNEGKNEYTIAWQLRRMNIRGTFTCIPKNNLETQRMERLAYYSENPLYTLSRPDVTEKEVLKDMRRYHVNYFFVYEDNIYGNFTDESGKPFPEITNGRIEGLKIFQVNP